jgi:predicted Rossmann fold flavoprotein
MSSGSQSTAAYDVIIVGAGAAGLLAACRAAERGLNTLLLEKNRKPGVKILMSGGTRCNITHDCDAAGIIAAFGSAGPFLHSALAALGPRDLVTLFNDEGLPTKVEPGGKVFPQSDRAADVLDTLLRRLRRSGAELALGEAVTDVVPTDEAGLRAGHLSDRPTPQSFNITTSKRTLRATMLLITSGGKSYPGCGTVGDGYSWLANLGHTIRQPRPALVPLTSDEPWVHELSGVTVPDVIVSVCNSAATESAIRRRQGAPAGLLMKRRGSLLFTHFGLSGPAVLDVSRGVTAAANPRELVVSIDFLPVLPREALNDQLRLLAASDGKKLVVTQLADWLPKKLCHTLATRAQVAVDRRTAELSKVERASLVSQLKQCEVCITGSRGFDKAEVTAGGVSLDEVDSRTMESKLVPGLFIAGEILDLDGFIGGYNFQAAFSTGWLAGESV